MKRLRNTILALLTILSVFGMISGSNEPIIEGLTNTWIEPYLYKLHIGNNILFNLSVSIFAGIFLWVLVVLLPELRSRSILKNNLKIKYNDFKEGIIDLLLLASTDSCDLELSKKLLDHSKFRKYFQENSKNWYDALNGIEKDEWYLTSLLAEITVFANEVEYILNNLSIEDERVHSFFKNLLTNVYKIKEFTVSPDEHFRDVMTFIWRILAHRSFVNGQREEDIVQVMIDQI